MADNTKPWLHPIFFHSNRVFRVYLGGRLFSDFMGDDSVDSNFPEEWVCSTVRAVNDGRDDPLEGISRQLEDGKPFHELIAENPAEYLGDRKDLGVLVKYLDSAIRLPMQVHPTRSFSREHFNSPYGKAEAWLVLATRPDACIYFGFSRAVSREEFAAAVEESETNPESMTRFVNRVPVHSGDVFFVNAGVVHAIGAGCLILEVQEPSDYTIQPEYWCGDYHLNAKEMYLGLSPETAMDCFNFELYGQKVVDMGRKTPVVLRKDEKVTVEGLVTEDDTPCFFMTRYTLNKGEVSLDVPASIWVCVEGSGTVISDEETRSIKQGDYFFIPAAAAGKCVVSTEDSVRVVCCVGGK